ncbi:hypothetical protein [Dongia sp.]|uniref:hypothetical protein n=1 Tax=Dongia sp. TaxID=1977262 RepID=UPI0035B3C8A4
MVNVAQAVSSGVSGTALFVRASAASAALAVAPVGATAATEAAAAQPADQVVVPTAQSYRYNSFEFSYRQDFGKIVLLRQEPDTGEIVQQFPSEYYLRKYADGQRVARTAADGAQPSGNANASAEVQVPSGSEAASATSRASVSVAPAPVAATPAPTPTVPSAPSLPNASASTAAVDVTV